MSPSYSSTPPPRPLDAGVGAPRPEGSGGDAGGLLCRVCGLDEVPWPRTAYCSERCRRRAAYLARRRPDRAAGRQATEGETTRGTLR
jgi:hypothetical protein